MLKVAQRRGLRGKEGVEQGRQSSRRKEQAAKRTPGPRERHRSPHHTPAHGIHDVLFSNTRVLLYKIIVICLENIGKLEI